MPYRYVAVPVKAENSNTLPVVQKAFGVCVGIGLATWPPGPDVLAREVVRPRRGAAERLKLTIDRRSIVRWKRAMSGTKVSCAAAVQTKRCTPTLTSARSRGELVGTERNHVVKHHCGTRQHFTGLVNLQEAGHRRG